MKIGKQFMIGFLCEVVQRTPLEGAVTLGLFGTPSKSMTGANEMLRNI